MNHPCLNCGETDDWHEDGRGNVLCGCQLCPDCHCVDAYGFHEPDCPYLAELENAAAEQAAEDEQNFYLATRL